jgi:G:T/U-mismatch repair DNA glycosylase
MIAEVEWTSEHHPWNYYVPPNAKSLIIGTFPTAKKNWSFDFFYPNKRNLLWRVLASICNRELTYIEHQNAVAERKEILNLLQTGITDMGKSVKRYKESSLDEKLELDVPMDIFSIIDEYPSIDKIVLTSSSGRVSALKWFVKYLSHRNISVDVPKGRKPLSFSLSNKGKHITVYILYSPSPRASNRISFSALVDMYKKVLK